MIVTKLKTKVMVFGSKEKACVHFNGKAIEEVQKYEYLGNIVSTINTCIWDICSKIL